MAEENTASETQRDLLPLDSEGRVVSWTMRGTGALRRHLFRPVTPEAARKFWKDLNPLIEPGGLERANAQVLGSYQSLWMELIRGVEGYALAGGRDFAALPDWKLRVPQGDRRRAIEWMVGPPPYGAGVSPADSETEYETGFDVVRLDALWNEDPPGAMRWHTGLTHKFQPRTEQEEADLRGELSRHFTVGGSRRGLTRPATRALVLVRFYDRMIRGVGGYGLSSHALGEREEIIARMDPFHKLAAVERWLEGSSDVIQPDPPRRVDDEEEE